MARATLIWFALAVAILLPIGVAATSPQLAWRGPAYIAAGFAGVAAMALLLVQPLLIGGYLPGLTVRRKRQIHAWVGGALFFMIIAHVGGLWWTSPPDVIDALLFRSPTPFSDWGVIAMWAVFLTAAIALFRRRLPIRPALWRLVHLILAVVIVVGSVVHALLIEGTMEQVSKIAICVLVFAATFKVIVDLKPWVLRRRKRA